MLSKTKTLTYLVMTTLVLLMFTGCGQTVVDNPNQTPVQDGGTATKPVVRDPVVVKDAVNKVTIYFATTDAKYLVPLTVDINATKEVALIAMQKLVAGPSNDFAVSLIPRDTKVREIYAANNYIYVDFSKDILAVDADKAQLAIDSIVTTISNVTGKTKVQILVEGDIINDIGKVNVSAPLEPKPINYIASKEKKTTDFKVYFSDLMAMYLVPVTIAVPSDQVDAVLSPKTSLELLLNGPPQDTELVSTVWQGTKLLGYSEDRGVATVDLSSDVLNYGGGSAAESMLINSILYTLSEYDSITTVQLLINGEKREFLPEGTDINQPIAVPAYINMVG